MLSFRYLSAILVAIMALSVACGPSAPTAAPAKATAAAPASSAPTPAAPAASKIKRGGTLVVADGNTPNTLDPLFDVHGGQLNTVSVYEGLLGFEVTDFKESKQEVRPLLAESWQQSDPKTIVLKLRQGVKFHDGTDFNAEIAKWNLERLDKHPKSLAKRLVQNIASMETPDQYTLKINYKEPSALSVLNLTTATGGTGGIATAMISKAAWDKMGEEAFGNMPVGTGPMKVVEWKRDDKVTFARSDNHWRMGEDGKPLPYLDGIISRYIADVAVALTELKTESVHIAYPGASDLPTLKNMSNIDTLLMPWAPRRQQFGFNDKKPPFGNNLKLRQAAAYATDKDSIAKVMGLDAGSPNHWWGWNKAWPGFDDKLPYYEFNPTKAEATLKEAGFPNGIDIDVMCYSGNTHRRYTEMLQSMWTKVGIRAKVSPIETVAGKAKAKAGEFEGFAWDMSPSPDPAHFNRMFLSAGEANWNNYANPEMDKCMLDAERETDAAKRADIYKKCQRIQYEDAQIGGMHFVSSIVTMNKQVKGLRVQTGMIDTRDVWLDK